jgi:hypothetical protein
MDNEIRPGDLVVCVDDTGALNIRVGAVDRVIEAGERIFAPLLNVQCEGVRLARHAPNPGDWGFAIVRFRKLNDGEGDEATLRQIVRCFNKPQPVTTKVVPLTPSTWGFDSLEDMDGVWGEGE